VAAWVDGAAAEHGRIDGIVNNAGIAPADPLENVSVEVWREVIDCNVTSMFLVTRAAIKHLRAAGGGSIVNLGSTFGVVGAGGSSVYSLTKAAAISLSQSLALELAPDRIRVNALCPGGTQTEFLEDWFVSTGDPDGTRDWLVGRLPIGRLGQPDEQAAAALFLMSDDASFVTGHALLVDGGYTAQ
jgi:NAD(P)-dependent dehydrogenase (short-subunit alcohol dehydrogenase family)